MLNKATLIGNVGSDVDVKTFDNGGQICTFSLATNERWKDKSGEQQEHVEWHRIVVKSGGLVGICERYVSKGSKLYVEGKIQTRKYEKDGQGKFSREIVVGGFDGKIVMLGDKGQDGASSGGYGGRSSNNAPASHDEIDDDIPF